MRFSGEVKFDCDSVGLRVTLRHRLPDGTATDVVGILERCDEASFIVRDKRSELHTVNRADAIAGKVIPSPAWTDDD